MDSTVYILPCPDYAAAPEKLSELLRLMGGMERFVKPGERIFLKANLLNPSPPESAVCTHPAVAAGTAALVEGAGASPLLGDSPGAGYHYGEGILRRLYAVSGMEGAGVALNFDASWREVSNPSGRVLKRMEIISPALDCAGIIDLCKLKTHMFMGMTGAVKNLFGLIPGRSKVGFHATMPDQRAFAHMLLDLACFAAPRLCIMDAVLAMEGQGPGASGTPRQVGLLLASENPLALDTAAGYLIGLPREQNPLLLSAQERGLGPTRAEDLTVVGPPLESLRVPGFRLPSTVHRELFDILGPIKRPAERLVRAVFSPAPRVERTACVGCGICKAACPAGAISLDGGKAAVDPGRCIRCFCCHELCPHRAVALRRGALARLSKRI